jgi:hypothetical protein
MCVDLEKESPEEVETYTLSVNGYTISVDLCGDCHKTWVGDVFEALLAVGREPTKVPKTPTRSTKKYLRQCKDCEETFTSGSVFTQHRKTAHPEGVTVVQPKPKKYPTVSLISKEKFVCTEKGCDKSFSRAQSLGVHKRYVHGITGSRSSALRSAS